MSTTKSSRDSSSIQNNLNQAQEEKKIQCCWKDERVSPRATELSAYIFLSFFLTYHVHALSSPLHYTSASPLYLYPLVCCVLHIYTYYYCTAIESTVLYILLCKRICELPLPLCSLFLYCRNILDATCTIKVCAWDRCSHSFTSLSRDCRVTHPYVDSYPLASPVQYG